MLIRNHLN